MLATPIGYQAPQGNPWASLDEERQEALESVLSALAAGDRDPDREAASTRLLRHLIHPSPLRFRSAAQVS